MSVNSKFQASQAGLNITFFELLKTGILSTWPNYNIDFRYKIFIVNRLAEKGYARKRWGDSNEGP